PGLCWGLLVVPHVLAGLGVDRHDGGQEQVIPSLRIAVILIPRRAIADAEVDQVGDGVIDQRVPGGAAAAALQPLRASRAPGGGRLLHRIVLRRLRGIAGHSVEAPVQLAGLGVVSADIAAYAILTAGHTHQYPTFGHARRTGDGVALLRVDGERLPQRLAGSRIDRDQPALERTHVDLAVPGGNA